MQTPDKPNARTKLLEAAMKVIRMQGYSGTTVDDLCASAGVTKGAFFHHFKSKDDLGVAAALHWTQSTGALFAQADYHSGTDPLDRIFAYLDLRESLLRGATAEFTCLAGTLLQEMHQTAPGIAQASYAAITSHAKSLEPDFAAAITLYGPADCPSAESLALHTQAVLQGGFILAKGEGSAEPARDALNHLRRYLKLLFNVGEDGR
jgi:TetR/AcrR family transcriptional repressor of nem operon